MSQAKQSLRIAIMLYLLLINLSIQIGRFMSKKKIEEVSLIFGEKFRTLIGLKKTKNHLILTYRNDKNRNISFNYQTFYEALS